MRSPGAEGPAANAPESGVPAVFHGVVIPACGTLRRGRGLALYGAGEVPLAGAAAANRGGEALFLYSWPGGSWQATAAYLGVLAGLYIAAFWLTLVFWTARDIRQRSNSQVTQVAAVLLVVVAFLPGLWLYLVMRPRYTRSQRYAQALEEEALRMELEKEIACPKCSRAVREDFLVCPACRARLKQPCPSCSKPLANAWVACPYCGMDRAPKRAAKPVVVAGRALPAIEVVPRERVEESTPIPAQPTPIGATAVAVEPTGTAG